MVMEVLSYLGCAHPRLCSLVVFVVKTELFVGCVCPFENTVELLDQPASGDLAAMQERSVLRVSRGSFDNGGNRCNRVDSVLQKAQTIHVKG